MRAVKDRNMKRIANIMDSLNESHSQEELDQIYKLQRWRRNAKTSKKTHSMLT